MDKADLHLHSDHSDGSISPTALVRAMADHGFSIIALTDHDSVDGIPEAVAAGAHFGVEVIPGVELSVAYRNYRDVHLLGYFVDCQHKPLTDLLEQFRFARAARGRKILDKLNQRLTRENRIPLTYGEVLEGVEGSLGRPHIGRALIRRGYVESMEDAFERYLGPCNVPKQYIPIGEGIRLIRQSGGVPVLAHPLSVSRDMNEIRLATLELAAAGLQGLEVFCPMATAGDSALLEDIARERKLAVTGGSDYHGDGALWFPGIDAGLVDHLRRKRPVLHSL